MINTKELLELHKTGVQPRVHGNGFIQLDIKPGVRLHIWGHPAIPRQETYTGIHDHTFGFSSTVLRGRVFQIPYHNLNDKVSPEYHVYKPTPRDGEDTELMNTGDMIRLLPGLIQIVNAGQYYMMRPRQIHETVADMPAATLMTKLGDRAEGAARVFVPSHAKPDNEFNRNNRNNQRHRYIMRGVWSQRFGDIRAMKNIFTDAFRASWLKQTPRERAAAYIMIGTLGLLIAFTVLFGPLYTITTLVIAWAGMKIVHAIRWDETQ